MMATQEEVRQRLASYRVEVAKERGTTAVGIDDKSDKNGNDDKIRGEMVGVGVIGSESVGGSVVVDDNDDDDEEDDDAPSSDGDAISVVSLDKGEEEGEEDNDLEDGQVVSEEEYMSYVRDADIECYLRGLLWVGQMYLEGVCPDFSYSFAG